MSVTRCVCYQLTFAELKERCRREDWSTVAEISLETGCGLGCGSCRRYLQAMLDTGTVCFAIAEPGQSPKPAAETVDWKSIKQHNQRLGSGLCCFSPGEDSDLRPID